MSTPEAVTRPISQVHINQLNRDTGEVESGYEVKVRDAQTGVVFPVFIPDAVYGTDQAKTLIQHELDKVRGVHSLTF